MRGCASPDLDEAWVTVWVGVALATPTKTEEPRPDPQERATVLKALPLS